MEGTPEMVTETLTVQAVAPDRKSFTQLIWQSSTIVALVVLIVVFAIASGGRFASASNLTNILNAVAILTIVAVAQTIVMVVGDFDLSVGMTATLGGATAGALLVDGANLAVGILGGVGVGVLVGAVNGLLVAFLNISAFVATLATMTAVGGLNLLITDGTNIYGWAEQFNIVGQMRINGIPAPVIYAVLISIVVWLILRFTTLGRRWYAIGGNAEVARLSGVSVRPTRFFAFVAAGGLSALAGVVLVSRLGSAGPHAADDRMMFAVAAVFLGMTLLRSGQANIGGTLIGVAIIGVVQNGLNLVGINTYIQQVLIGAIIIGAVLLSGLKNKNA
ncbi:ABC transporter permease [Microbacterium sp.]|uniref:ABC transporter permease n=1 Tax=Microbacterium sp. TaxID=51671 RepID=UPI002810E12E|nr:ABC transporter permease [Microbacterium sp.]